MVGNWHSFFLWSGFFIEPDYSTVAGQAGVFKTGQWYMLGVQVLTAVLVIVWTAVCTWITLMVRLTTSTSFQGIAISDIFLCFWAHLCLCMVRSYPSLPVCYFTKIHWTITHILISLAARMRLDSPGSTLKVKIKGQGHQVKKWYFRALSWILNPGFL